MQNPLYSAIIALGRMMDDVRSFGWACGTLGSRVGPKCVNGGLTMAFGATFPCYISVLIEEQPKRREAVRLASVALVKSIDNPLRQRLAAHYKKYEDAKATVIGERLLDGLVHPELASIETLEALMYHANDEYIDELLPYLDQENVLAWYNRAQDLLAEDLLPPAPLMSEAEMDEFLAAQLENVPA